MRWGWTSMRKVDRAGDIPASLSKKRRGKSEYERAVEFFGKPAADSGDGAKKKKFTFSAYRADDVKRSLEALFHGKCAYCESRYATTAPIDVEHYRPKASVREDDKHSGYWWLAMKWDNLLPSCIDCNRRRRHATPRIDRKTGSLKLVAGEREPTFPGVMTTGKGDSFPIAGTRLTATSMDYRSEGALLLNPCEDEPYEHLEFHIDVDKPLGLVLPKASRTGQGVAQLPPFESGNTWEEVGRHASETAVSLRGAVSIQVYGLNRMQLVRERTRILRRLEFLEAHVIHTTAVIEDLDQLASERPELGKRLKSARVSLDVMRDLVLSEMREMAHDSAPYSAMTRAWMRDFVGRLSA